MNSNPLLQLTFNRARTAKRRLEAEIWEPVADLDVLAGEPLEHAIALSDAKSRPVRKIESGSHWGKLYDQRWFRVNIPKGKARPARYLRWMDQSQAIAYVNDVPYWGFDPMHRYCEVPAAATEVWLEGACINPFLPDSRLDDQGSRFDGAALFTRNDDAWHAYHSLDVLLAVTAEHRRLAHPELGREPRWVGYQPPVEKVPVIYRRLLRALEEFVDALDTGGVSAARKTGERLIEEFPADPLSLRCTLAGHAHIDLVWLWPERVAQFKTQHTFSLVNRLMDDYPELRFTHSQPASYRAIETRAPELMRAVRKRIQQGRWEATGAMEVESDTLIACGEALVRSFLVGQKKFKELTGKLSRLLWLPDVFGYAGCLPQMMRECGAPYFFTTKLHWGAITRFPFSSFRWEGADGSSVIAHVTHDFGYNGTVDVAELKVGEEAYRQSDVHGEFIAPTGYGDGAGGPTAEMCERARRLGNFNSVPKVSWGLAEEYFDGLAKLEEQLPVYKGELYLENHRGTLTTHGDLKAAFRKAECSLRTLEAALAATSGQDAPEELWQRMVFAQFHDYIPGSSVPPVYSEALPELANLSSTALAQAKKNLSRARGSRCLFNPLPQRLRWHDEEAGWLELPPLSGVNAARADIRVSAAPVICKGRTLSNGLVTAGFDSDGRIASLVIEGEPVRFAGPAAKLVSYPDHPAIFNAWDIDRQTLSLGEEIARASRPVAVTLPCGTIKLSFDYKVGGRSTASVVYGLRPGERVLHIDVELDWRDGERLLRMHFPTNYSGRNARFGMPYGTILRTQHPGDPRDEAQWEVPASRHGTVLDDNGAGFFLVTEAKYGFSARSGDLTVSLVRSPLHTGVTGESHSQMYPESLRRARDCPRFTDNIKHHIRLAVGLSHPGLAGDQQPAALAESLFAAPLEYRGAEAGCGFLGITGGDSLQPSWAKPAGRNAWILRLHETLGAHGSATLELGEGWSAGQVDLSENRLGDLPGGRIDFRPYQIVSVRLQKSDGKHAAP